MGVAASQSKMRKPDHQISSVKERKLIGYCQKDGQLFDQNDFDIHKKVNQTHECFQFPEFFFSPLIEKYKFTKFIGYGSFTKVFEIKINSQKRALKWVNLNEAFKGLENEFPEKSQAEMKAETKIKSEKECNLFRALNHDNVLAIYEFFWATESDLIIIMELGKAMVTKESQGQTHDKQTQWFFQICQVVKYLHRNNIIHKKLSPHNILVTEDGKIIVGDIGGSQKFLCSDIENLFLLAPKYLPPEITKLINEGKEPIFTKGTDIWALGIIYHMMLTKNINPVKKNGVIIAPSIVNAHDRTLIER